MSKKALRKNSIREIKLSFGRFLAILAIVALGVGLFAGLKVTRDAMLVTGDNYLRENNFFDYRLISTLGLYEEDVEALKELPFITDAEGTYSVDVIVEKEDHTDSVAKLHGISDKINKIIVTEGRLPVDNTECVVDSKWFAENIVGQKLVISDSNSEDTLDMFAGRELTVVGLCQSSLYINFERGNTNLGSGKISGFIYVNPDFFDCDYFTEVYAVSDMSDEMIYSDEYEDGTEPEIDELEVFLEKRAFDKYTEIKSDADEEISDAQAKLDDARATIAENEQKIADGKKEIEDGEKTISDSEAKIADAEKEISDGEKQIADGRKEIKKAKKTLEDSQAELDAVKVVLPPEMYAAKQAEIDAGKAALNEKEKELYKAQKELDEGRKEIEEHKLEIEDAKEDIEKAKKDISDGEKEIEDARKEVDEHQKKVDDAREELDDLEEPDTYVLGRPTNIGYACFENDSAIVEGIGNVFPVFFFLVAALVCMTTMNRMVEEKRTEIGTMKALGYSEGAIMNKYLFYSGSAAIVGCVGGFFVGSKLFPVVIWEAYGIMYTMPDIVFVFDLGLAIVSLIVSVMCSMGATYLTLKSEMQSNAADLIRPKAPANGKRVFLERIGFIWKRMKFTSKVSVRNVFRYQKRLWMMVLGVGGCYGLLITGFGIKDSIADVCDCQFKNIQKYGITVTFKDDSDISSREEFENEVEALGEYIYVESKSVDVDAGNKVKSATLVVFPDTSLGKSLSDFIKFTDEKGIPLSLPQKNEAILTAKMAKLLGVNVGDSVILRDPDLNEITVSVSGIMRNYVYNWAYISEETYVGQRGKEPGFNSALVRTSTDNYEVGASLGNIDYVSSVSVADEMSIRIGNMMESLNEIVYVVILCAAALAFIVMYNLTNINITERLREIATLKVLGFYPFETAVYVFRENLILTAFGIIAGFFMGYGLHRYVMYNITVEAVTFDTKILPQSYFYGVILTFMFALIVDVVLFFKLERIKMAESLKSVE